MLIRSVIHKIQKLLLAVFTIYVELIMSFEFQTAKIGSEVSILRNKSKLQRNLRNNINFKMNLAIIKK